MHKDQQSILESLVNGGPQSFSAYLLLFEEGALIAGLSMLTIFDYAASLAKGLGSVEWAEVALWAARLEARSCRGIEQGNVSLRAMNLRAWFISKMGAIQHHPVLDREAILHWAIEGLSLPIETVKMRATTLWQSVARVKNSADLTEMQEVAGDLHQLRQIKLRLDIVKVLADRGELPENSILNEWLRLRKELP